MEVAPLPRWLFDLEARAIGQPVVAYTRTLEASTIKQAIADGLRQVDSPEWGNDAQTTTISLSVYRLAEPPRP